VTPSHRVLTIVACGAGPAAALSTCAKLARDRGWTVQVTATPAALGFFDAAAIEDQTGSPVRSQYARPGAPRSLIPDAILVAPATYNTINKWPRASATPTPWASSPRRPAWKYPSWSSRSSTPP
jgi:phosphopantothenoylcysteine synthetase/decarboxylase